MPSFCTNPKQTSSLPKPGVEQVCGFMYPGCGVLLAQPLLGNSPMLFPVPWPNPRRKKKKIGQVPFCPLHLTSSLGTHMKRARRFIPVCLSRALATHTSAASCLALTEGAQLGDPCRILQGHV